LAPCRSLWPILDFRLGPMPVLLLVTWEASSMRTPTIRTSRPKACPGSGSTRPSRSSDGSPRSSSSRG
jgi:hypothetical protein